MQKLFNETFPYLKLSNELPSPTGESKGSEVISINTEQVIDHQKTSVPKGELRTSIGSVMITNKSQIKLARTLLDVFEEELENKLENESNHIKGKKTVVRQLDSVEPVLT